MVPLYTESLKKAFLGLQDSASWRGGKFTQPRKILFEGDCICTVLYFKTSTRLHYPLTWLPLAVGVSSNSLGDKIITACSRNPVLIIKLNGYWMLNLAGFAQLFIQTRSSCQRRKCICMSRRYRITFPFLESHYERFETGVAPLSDTPCFFTCQQLTCWWDDKNLYAITFNTSMQNLQTR